MDDLPNISKPTHFKVGGVPEHFNFPWIKAIDEGLFEKKNISISWKDYFGGTGAMTKALRSSELDIAILLTEGIIADIHKGNPSKIVQFYVQSSLRWGIHVGSKSKFKSVSDLENTRSAISRFGSGSHLMSYVNSSNEGWDLDKQKLEVVNDLKGGRSFLANGKADYFLWEKYTTKPFVDNGEFRILGECPTPWPSFVVAVREDLLHTQPQQIKQILDIVNQSCFEVKSSKLSVKQIADYYQLQEQDITQWLGETQWSCNSAIDPKTIDLVQERLLSLQIIEDKKSFYKLCSPFQTKLMNKTV